MKLCFYNVTASYLHGGLETYCWEAGRAMARRGHTVDIVAGDRGVARHEEVSLFQFPFRPEKEWPDLGVRARRLAERISFARTSMHHLLLAEYDAIVVNKPFDFPILWFARRQGLRSTTVFRSGGTDFFLCDRRFSSAVDCWLSASGYNALQVESRFGRGVKVVHNGVDTDVFRPVGRCSSQRSQWALDEEVLLVSVGRLVGWKGIDVAIDAVAMLNPGIRYLIVGEGPEMVALKARADQLGVTGRVAFAGRVPHDDLPALLSQCDVFVQPSVGEEAFGISIVEAMACGLPVVATENGGIPEIVVPGETGVLVTPGDAVELARELGRIASSAALRMRMGAAGRFRALAEFTWARNAELLEQSIKEARPCAAS